VPTIPEVLSLEEFTDVVEKQSGTILDARPQIFYRMSHVPGALSLPRDDFENGYSTIRTRLRTDLGHPIVVYCADTSCTDASLVKKSLNALGHSNVGIFSGGWREWTQSGKETESGP
jgi:3-mercaptopyruvate sulfurtransferase SseA